MTTDAIASDSLDELAWLTAEFKRSLGEVERQGGWAVGAGPMSVARPLFNENTMVAENSTVAAPPTEPGRSLALADVQRDLGDCQRCKLAKTRDQIVFGVGSASASLMFVGEAPGAEEDKRGEPFVGRAGGLLDKMIAAMGWSRETVYIANVLKCRPPGNRDPQADEVEACESFLARQIDAISPRLIVTLGKPAAHLVLNTKAPIGALRGSWKEYRGIPVMPTFHPAYLLRSPDKKRQAWSDLKLVITELDRLGVKPPNPSRA